MDQKLNKMFQQIGCIIDMTMTLSLFTAAKTLTLAEFDIVMAICERQFINTGEADPKLYYEGMEEFKKLFEIFKNHPF